MRSEPEQFPKWFAFPAGNPDWAFVIEEPDQKAFDGLRASAKERNAPAVFAFVHLGDIVEKVDRVFGTINPVEVKHDPDTWNCRRDGRWYELEVKHFRRHVCRDQDMTDELRVETPKELAARVNVPERKIRTLIGQNRLEHVLIGSRVYIPQCAWGRFIEANMRGKQWRDETMVQNSVGSTTEVFTTSSGHSTAGVASVRRARVIASKLKSSSPSGSISELGDPAPVIRLKCW
jgi:hypothetical protein